MKNKLLYLFLMITGIAFAQPAIQQPSDYFVCDDNNDGVSIFDLTTKIPEILNGLDPALYTLAFYETIADAEMNSLNNVITNTTAYSNIIGMSVNSTQVLYVRVTNVTNVNDYELAALNLVVGYTPVLNQLQDLVVYEDPSDGVAQFNLTTQNQYVVNLPSLYAITYYTSQADAAMGVNPLLGNYTNTTNPQVIYVRVEDVSSGCFSITNFNLVVTEGTEPIVNIPDANFKANLIALGHDTNNDGEIQVSEANAVSFLNISNSNISDLTGINSFHNLTYLTCNGNNLTTLSISGLPLLFEVHLDGNNLTAINLDNLPQLGVLYAPNNELTTIDLSQVNILELTLAFNSGLTYINLKNGVNGVNYLNIEDTTVQFICTDEADVQGYATAFPNIQVSSYCDFTPGGDYNTITGTILFDANNNGCDAQDVAHDFIKVNITGSGQTGSAFTNAAGNYTFYTQGGNFTLTPQLEDNSLFTITPASAAINFADNNNNTQIQDFCIAPNGVHSDVEVVIAPVGGAQPGFAALYKIVYRNKGNQIENGTVTFTYNESVLDYVTSLPIQNTNAPGVLTYNYTNLMPFENREILVTFSVNEPTETPAVNIGDVLDYSASVTIAGTDEMPNDNNFELHQVVVGSFDPNDITCIQGAVAPADIIGDYLYYVVNFENTGTAQATFIVVKQDIDATMFDVNSLQVLNSSHGVTATVNGNKVEFVFNNIYLDANEHGNILFKMKSLSTLQTGDTVMNQANIYFDYNFPIETNEANTTFATLTIGNFVKDTTVKVYPNPTNGLVNIKANGTINTIELFDIQGRLLQTSVINNTNTTVDISGKQSGIYFIRIKTDKGMSVEKIVKQ